MAENEKNESTREQGRIKMDIFKSLSDDDSFDDTAANEKLKEANKRLPAWDLRPPVGYKG